MIKKFDEFIRESVDNGLILDISAKLNNNMGLARRVVSFFDSYFSDVVDQLPDEDCYNGENDSEFIDDCKETFIDFVKGIDDFGDDSSYDAFNSLCDFYKHNGNENPMGIPCEEIAELLHFYVHIKYGYPYFEW